MWFWSIIMSFTDSWKSDFLQTKWKSTSFGNFPEISARLQKQQHIKQIAAPETRKMTLSQRFFHTWLLCDAFLIEHLLCIRRKTAETAIFKALFVVYFIRLGFVVESSKGLFCSAAFFGDKWKPNLLKYCKDDYRGLNDQQWTIFIPL